MIIDNKPEFREAYRDAAGITYRIEQERALKQLQQASRGARILKAISNIGILSNAAAEQETERQLQSTGFRTLRNLVDQGFGIYARGPVFYWRDIEQATHGFMYNLVFSGERVGEKGKVAMTYKPQEVLLKRGIESVVEIEENGAAVLHVPEGEGVSLANMTRVKYGWSSAEKFAGYETWYPDLSDIAQLFRVPEGGTVTFDVKPDHAFLNPYLPVSLYGDHRYYDTLVRGAVQI